MEEQIGQLKLLLQLLMGLLAGPLPIAATPRLDTEQN
mgnify:CR=1 FL=1